MNDPFSKKKSLGFTIEDYERSWRKKEREISIAKFVNIQEQRNWIENVKKQEDRENPEYLGIDPIFMLDSDLKEVVSKYQKLFKHWKWIKAQYILRQEDLAQTYLQPHYGNGVFGNVYLSAGQH